MRKIKNLNDIDRSTIEGKLLFAALAKITTESQTDKTPDEVIIQVNELSDYMEKNSIEKIECKPCLGCATTGELLKELTARAEVNGYADYKTVDN